MIKQSWAERAFTAVFGPLLDRIIIRRSPRRTVLLAPGPLQDESPVPIRPGARQVIRHDGTGEPYETALGAIGESYGLPTCLHVGQARCSHATEPEAAGDRLLAYGDQAGRHAAMPDGTARQYQPPEEYTGPPIGARRADLADTGTVGIDPDSLARALKQPTAHLRTVQPSDRLERTTDGLAMSRGGNG